jgi:hypothetical protein
MDKQTKVQLYNGMLSSSKVNEHLIDAAMLTNIKDLEQSEDAGFQNICTYIL